MAITTTTLSSAAASGDTVINVTSATAFAAGLYLYCNGEVMQISKSYSSGTAIPVQRGLDGTISGARASGASISVFALPSDFPQFLSGQTNVGFPLAGRARILTSYIAAGAISLPTAGNDALAIIDGGSALAMTLASPGRDIDGCMLTIVGTQAKAHTVTITAGFGGVGATADVMTFSATQAQGFQCLAYGGFWTLIGPLAVATASVSGPSLA